MQLHQMENKQVSLTLSDYPQERLIHVLAQRVSARVFAMQANWKRYSQQ